LRIAELRVAAAERVALLGFDQASAEVFVNLATGATLPDAGDVRISGRSTRSIDDPADWLSTVDRFGIVSDRAVLLEALTVIQNLAMPFTLDIEPPAEDIRRRAVALAEQVGLDAASLDRPVAELPPAGLVRIRLGRALALDPAVVILEHPTAEIPPEAAAELAAECRTISAATITLTADAGFAEAASRRCLTLDPATGRLAQRTGWLSRLLRG
jgi:predicted ABC-type transport system involved in lysophospholipase L1 biosynthesis ATPase subunit